MEGRKDGRKEGLKQIQCKRDEGKGEKGGNEQTKQNKSSKDIQMPW